MKFGSKTRISTREAKIPYQILTGGRLGNHFCGLWKAIFTASFT